MDQGNNLITVKISVRLGNTEADDYGALPTRVMRQISLRDIIGLASGLGHDAKRQEGFLVQFGFEVLRAIVNEFSVGCRSGCLRLGDRLQVDDVAE